MASSGTRRRLWALVVVPGVLACAHSPPLRPDQSQLRCFGLALDLSAAQAGMVYFRRVPTFVEFRAEDSTFPLRRGLVVRTSPYPGTEFGPSGVWHPLEHGGIAFDWGTGFAGFTVEFAKSGPRYVGRAETYADIEGVPVQSFAASLDPATCDHGVAQRAVAADAVSRRP